MMRAVALGDESIQQKVNKSFIPLKIVLDDGESDSREFPLDWPAMRKWKLVYNKSGIRGFTGCSVVSPDLSTEYGSTGSAMVWEMFDSVAYDSKKFNTMLDDAIKFAREEMEIRKASTSQISERIQLAKFRVRVNRHRHQQGRMRMPPEGFSVEKAKDLFRLTGDLEN